MSQTVTFRIDGKDLTGREGQTILEALQFAAKGPGVLGGLAILLVAMVIDRVVQGAFRRKGLQGGR